jgi:hypothetical protein
MNIDPFATEVVLFLKSGVNDVSYSSILFARKGNIFITAWMCGGLRVEPAMTEEVVAMTVRFVFSCPYAKFPFRQ